LEEVIEKRENNSRDVVKSWNYELKVAGIYTYNAQPVMYNLNN